MQVFKLTPEELAARKEILVLSDKGLRFREEVRQEQLDDFHLPIIDQERRASERKAQVTQEDILIQRPYLEKVHNKMTGKKALEKPTTQITSKLNNLYQELQKHTRLLEKRRVKFQKKHVDTTILDQTALLERSEMVDKVASQQSIEARMYKIQLNYEHELQQRENTMKKVQQNMNIQRMQRQAEIEQAPDPLYIESLRVSQYNDRKQTRLKDYQKSKFEKIWSKQPPPNYTSKQALIEAEKRRQQQLIREQQEYEMELQRRNGQ